MTTTKPANIDDYIAAFPKEVQKIMEEVRAHIHAAAPGAEETISYGMPTFNLAGRYLVYFAGFKNHLGFYPAPVGNKAFEADLAVYKTGKGSVQFPLNKPMPMDLITRIVQFRAAENLKNNKKG